MYSGLAFSFIFRYLVHFLGLKLVKRHEKVKVKSNIFKVLSTTSNSHFNVKLLWGGVNYCSVVIYGSFRLEFIFFFSFTFFFVAILGFELWNTTFPQWVYTFFSFLLFLMITNLFLYPFCLLIRCIMLFLSFSFLVIGKNWRLSLLPIKRLLLANFAV